MATGAHLVQSAGVQQSNSFAPVTIGSNSIYLALVGGFFARGITSIMPTLVGGNTNAAAIMIAERAAEWIAQA